MFRRRMMKKKNLYLNIISTPGATLSINNSTVGTINSAGIYSLVVKVGEVIKWIVEKDNYYSRIGTITISDSVNINAELTPMPAAQTISLFHCDGGNGTDEKSIAVPIQNHLYMQFTGKFHWCNEGWVQYQNDVWEHVFTSGAWTVDYWLYPIWKDGDSQMDVYLGGTNNGSALIRQETVSSGLLIFVDGINNLIPIYISAAMNNWHHVAFTYDGVILKVYTDGYLRVTHEAPQLTAASLNFFGTNWNNTYPSASWRDEIRISKGVRWWNNFTPPTAAET